MSKLVTSRPELFDSSVIQKGSREDIEIEKGVVLTSDYLEQTEELMQKYFSIFSAYPDLFLDKIKPADSDFTLFFYQRIVLRAIMRYKEVYITACLKGDTPILTEDGMVPIQDYDPNRRVWSGGEWMVPENLNARNWEGEYRTISAHGALEGDITVTDNHKFKVIKKKQPEEKIQWVEAKDIEKGDFLVSQIDTMERRLDGKLKDLDFSFFELFGMWLSDGSWYGEDFTIVVRDNDDLIGRVVELVLEIGDVKGFGYKTVDDGKREFSFSSKRLKEIFDCLYEEKRTISRREEKVIPHLFLHCAQPIQLQILKGFVYCEGNRTLSEEGDLGLSVAFTSSILCESIKIMFHRNVINPNIKTIPLEEKTFYILELNSIISDCFLDSFKYNLPLDFSNKDVEYWDDFFATENEAFLLNEVTNVQCAPPDGELVYCLQLENETFNINGVEGHNCRAFSKSFITILGLILQCVFIPRTKRFICAPNKNQSAQIAKEKIYEIYEHWPLLKKEVVGGGIVDCPGNFGKDYVTLRFRNDSLFDVVGALDSQRGGRRHGGLVDEIRKMN